MKFHRFISINYDKLFKIVNKIYIYILYIRVFIYTVSIYTIYILYIYIYK